MELRKEQKEALIKLAQAGFVGNWYNPFGREKLSIYKADCELPDYISLKISLDVIDITQNFPGVHFISKEADDLRASFRPALDIVSAIFKVNSMME